MKKPRTPFLRGFTVQLLAITILPLTLLLLLIAFGSISMHQQDMRSLVSERDARAVKSATAALEAELHHRQENVANLATLARSSRDFTLEKMLADSSDMQSDFESGMAFIDLNGNLIT